MFASPYRLRYGCRKQTFFDRLETTFSAEKGDDCNFKYARFGHLWWRRLQLSVGNFGSERNRNVSNP